MDNNTAELLSKLAEQLSTTSEHLWAVLVNHAHVSAINGLVECLLMIVFWVVVIKAHVWLSKKEGDYPRSKYSEYEASAAIPMVVAIIIALIFVPCFIYDLCNAIDGFFDPQYWALNRLLEVIGK